MKLKVFKYPDGKYAFASEGIRIEVNKQKPSEEVEIKTDKDTFDKIVANPSKYKLTKKKKLKRVKKHD